MSRKMTWKNVKPKNFEDVAELVHALTALVTVFNFAKGKWTLAKEK